MVRTLILLPLIRFYPNIRQNEFIEPTLSRKPVLPNRKTGLPAAFFNQSEEKTLISSGDYIIISANHIITTADYMISTAD